MQNFGRATESLIILFFIIFYSLFGLLRILCSGVFKIMPKIYAFLLRAVNYFQEITTSKIFDGVLNNTSF